MSPVNAKIVSLEPMRVISIYAFGEQPEEMAWKKLLSWMEENSFRIEEGRNRIFGFNNPSPSAGSIKYGYEFWITVDENYEPQGETKIKNFDGGLYAATEIQVTRGEEIPGFWQALNLWAEGENYSLGRHQWLEEHSMKGMPFAIYMPIRE